MIKKFVCAIILAPVLFWAADKFQPLNAKLGLWEMTSTRKMSGGPTAPSAPSIPADKLAQLPPAQRAQIEAMMQKRAGGATTDVRRVCVTSEKLAKAQFGEDKKSCERTVTNSSGTTMQFHEECTETDGSKHVADGKFEATEPGTVKGSMQIKATSGANKMAIDLDISGKWISADCGAVK